MPHLDLATLQAALVSLPTPPTSAGTVEKVVQRFPGERRACPPAIQLDVALGVVGDRWSAALLPRKSAQVTAMRADVARLLKQGDDYEILGDNLFISLDTSARNLPPGSRLRVGSALVEVTAKPHRGCNKFADRVGKDAWAITRAPEWDAAQLRGVHLRVLQGGTVRVGDAIVVESRG